ILTQPRNAITRQYQKLFEYENVKLRFTDDALEAIAESALTRKIGARGPRMIIEDLMLDLMYSVPGQKKLRDGVVTREVVEDKGFYRVVVKVLAKQKETAGDVEGTMGRVVSLFEQYVKLSNNLHYDAMIAAVRVDDPGKLADTIAAHLLVGVDEKQNLLEIISSIERLNRIAGILEIEVDKLQVDRRIQSRVKKQMEKAQKEYYLNEKM